MNKRQRKKQAKKNGLEKGHFDIEFEDGGYWEPDPKTGKLKRIRDLWPK